MPPPKSETGEQPESTAANAKDVQNTEPPKPQTLDLTIHKGDIFSAPPNTVLIHACNTQGSWGAGIALAFRDRYPEAYKVYRAHCVQAHDPKTSPVPTATCLLIPPCEKKSSSRSHWIACLFTSAKYGRGKDKPDTILANTGPAMRDLLGQVREKERGGEEVEGLRMCKINSARFGVPWERTVAVLLGVRVEEGWKRNVEVWTIDED